MPSACIFYLNRKNGVYYAGQTVHGLVKLKTTNVKYVTRITLRLKGVVRCGFNQTVVLGGEESCIPNTTEYFTSQENVEKMEEILHRTGYFYPGIHSWAFAFQIAPDCPTSMEGTKGHIHYDVRLKIRNLQYYDNIFFKTITVINKDDLNINPIYLQMHKTPAHSTMLYGLVATSAHFRLQTHFGAYAAGQRLGYTLNVYKKILLQYKVQFVRKTVYLANNPSFCLSDEEDVLYERSWPQCDRHYDTFIDSFQIPPTSPTIKTPLITVTYYLRISGKGASCATRCKAQMEVHLGTVPLIRSLLPAQQRAVIKYGPNRYRLNPTMYQRPTKPFVSFLHRKHISLNREEFFTPSYPTYTLPLEQMEHVV